MIMSAQQLQSPLASISTLKDVINCGTIRYAYNARLAHYTDPFDYMQLHCDKKNITYAIYGEHLSLNGIQFVLPHSFMKSIYHVFIFPAEVMVDPLQMEIDDELIMFLYLILDLYEQGKLLAKESADGKVRRIKSFG